MKYQLSCAECGWKGEADSLRAAVEDMAQHAEDESHDRIGMVNPKGDWYDWWYAKMHMLPRIEKMHAGRKRKAARQKTSLGTAKPKDMQKERVYAAERNMYEAGLNGGRVFEDVADMQAFTDKVMQSRFVASLVAPMYSRSVSGTTVKVVREGHSRGRVKEHYRRHRYDIQMPLPDQSKGNRNDRWTPLYLIHEIAHVVEDFTEEGRHEAAHGRTFVRVYLALVKRFLGGEIEFALKAELRAHKVKWAKQGVRAPMTPEEKAIVAKRLAAGRAKAAS